MLNNPDVILIGIIVLAILALGLGQLKSLTEFFKQITELISVFFNRNQNDNDCGKDN